MIQALNKIYPEKLKFFQDVSEKWVKSLGYKFSQKNFSKCLKKYKPILEEAYSFNYSSEKFHIEGSIIIGYFAWWYDDGKIKTNSFSQVGKK